MTLPSEVMKDVQSQRRQIWSQAKATKYYSKLANAIKGIKDTQGYEEIMNYRVREYDDLVPKLVEEDSENVGKVAKLQWELNSARKFLNFLDGMENPMT